MSTIRQIMSRWSVSAASALIGVYLVLEGVLRPIFRPLSRLLRNFPPIVWIRCGAGMLPPYGALAVLAAASFSADPAKVYGVFLIGSGRPLLGLACIAAAYSASLLIVDQIYEGAKPNLLQMGWFKALLDWLIAARKRTVDFARRIFHRGGALAGRQKQLKGQTRGS